ncbi:MAG TPA: NAD(P)/FAD-dependent oxidoreductase [Thermoanaerobaculia bacterium]|jgi:thioredoxin reductase|nr:NAD(P)/FAD-dependent oxidoreductase [Thermoanaerobaculia bacterium]
MTDSFDVIVVGGGPAGLSGAMVLGRCRFRVLVVDSGRGRNHAAPGVHGFLGSDGVLPAELRRRGQREARRYGVIFRLGEVVSIARRGDGFELTLARGGRLRCRRLLLATGVADSLPDVPGFAALYGKSVFHCPYCDGWETRDRPLALYGSGSAAARYAVTLTRWSADLVLLTDGPTRLRAADREALAAAGVRVIAKRIAALEVSGRRGAAARGRLARVRFADGEALPRFALFFASRPRQSCDLAASLGVRFTDKGMVQAGRMQDAGVPGVYVAGDASRDVQLAMIAAAEGVKAAVAIHADLDKERAARNGGAKVGKLLRKSHAEELGG